MLSAIRRAPRRLSPGRLLDSPLSAADPAMHKLIVREAQRQGAGLQLIASENFTSRAVLQALGSCLTNKYAEGLPGARYYGGNEVIDEIEDLCRTRALTAFKADPAKWGVNVQPYSGSVANVAAYAAVLAPHDRMMGLYLPHGGHLTHGFYSPTRRVSLTSVYYESLPYTLGADGRVDFDQLALLADRFRPKLIIAGGSAYTREWDYVKFREIATKVNALLMVDMAHISGLIAGGVAVSPFDYADLVTTTTHKSLRGPRAGMVFYRRDGAVKNADEVFNNAVFPGLQGGPHENQIAGVAVALHDAATPEFAAYQRRVVANAKALAGALLGKGYTLVSGGTDNHLMLVDLRPQKVSGAKLELVLDAVGITVNKNTVPGDVSAVVPGGIRIGTPAATTRGLNEADFGQVGEFIHRAVGIAQALQTASGPKLKDFREVLAKDSCGGVAALSKEVAAFCARFPVPVDFA